MIGTSTALQFATYGNLKCRYLAERVPDGPLIVAVLGHGYGAPPDDLVPFGAELKRLSARILKHVRFIFPEGPLTIGPRAYMDVRAWWPLNTERFLQATQQPDGAGWVEIRKEVPTGLAEASEALTACLDDISAKLKIPMSQILVGGFSQGAMVATDVALRMPKPPAGLAVFSGTLICEEEWRRLAPDRRGMPALITHGRQDPLLAFDNTARLYDVLAEAGLHVRMAPFESDHTISSTSTAAFIIMLEDLIVAAQARLDAQGL